MVFLKIVEQFYAKPNDSKPKIVEEMVDVMLRKQDGKISRNRDEQYCRHGESGMCSHCMPLEPFDAGYQEEKGVKHLSFHAYLRKISKANSNQSKGHILEDASFRVKPNCSGQHPPYPEGICTKCQPSAIVLNTQPFRMVDHVEMDNPKLIEEFLGAWRKTGYQRFGWLIGRYAVFEGVPLGIKAIVHAIYEPPQDGSVDGIQLLEDPNGEHVLKIATDLDLKVVGMVYTDLTDDGSRTGKVLHKRSSNTFFVSSSEALFMAQNQLGHPSPCTDSPTAAFSSKFVTVIITGNERNEIDFLPFQVSNTAEGMASADIIEATTDPSLMMVKPSIPKKHYVPEVMYKLNDEYGNIVQRKADPFFPVEYLLLTLSHGFPVKLDPFFKSPTIFPSLIEAPTMNHLKKYLEEVRSIPLTIALSNFNLIVFLAHQGILSPAEIQALCKALINSDEHELVVLTNSSANWASLVTIAEESEPSRSASSNLPDWTCPHCTFINVERAKDSCEICGLPAN